MWAETSAAILTRQAPALKERMGPKGRRPPIRPDHRDFTPRPKALTAPMPVTAIDSIGTPAAYSICASTNFGIIATIERRYAVEFSDSELTGGALESLGTLADVLIRRGIYARSSLA